MERSHCNRYNITPNERARLLSGQCQICQVKLAKVLDHDHRTGELRGGLCGACNLGIGLLGDTRQSLANALEYLQTHRSFRLSSNKVKLHEMLRLTTALVLLNIKPSP